MNEGLRPCPFCGSKNIEFYDRGGLKDSGRFEVECNFCGARVNGPSREIAEGVWNCRTERRDAG
jgi:Lar family restriction alleviation protein